MCIALQHTHRETNFLKHLGDALRILRRRERGFVDAQSFADEFLHGETRIERRERILKDNLDAAAYVAHSVWGKRQNVLPGKEHLPPGVLFEPYEAVPERRLPTARFPHETKGDAFRNSERHAVYCLHMSHHPLEKPLFHWKMRREVPYLNERRRKGGGDGEAGRRGDGGRRTERAVLHYCPCGEGVVWVVQIAGDLAPARGREEGWGCYRAACGGIVATFRKAAARHHVCGRAHGALNHQQPLVMAHATWDRLQELTRVWMAWLP